MDSLSSWIASVATKVKCPICAQAIAEALCNEAASSSFSPCATKGCPGISVKTEDKGVKCPISAQAITEALCNQGASSSFYPCATKGCPGIFVKTEDKGCPRISVKTEDKAEDPKTEEEIEGCPGISPCNHDYQS